MYQRQKKRNDSKTTKGNSKTSKVSATSEESNLQRRKCTFEKLRMNEEKSTRLEKGLFMSLEISTNNFTTTMSKKNLNKKSERMKMKAASTCKTTTPMRRRESQRSRQKSCATAINKLNQGKSPDSNGFEQKTSKLVTRRRKKW